MNKVCAGLIVLWLASASLVAATFTVTTTADSGAGSLRQAILDANANPGFDTIDFNIPGAGVHTITPATPLDPITDGVLIDGYSQPGTSANTDPIASSAVLLIELDGSAGGDTGFNIGGGANGSTVQGLVINRFGTGVFVRGGATNCVVRGNFIGTDPTGAFALSNIGGIQIGSGAGTMNTIGGTSPSDRNLVSGNTDGLGAILLESPTLVEGNLIGTDASGTHAVPNLLGLDTSNGSTIGGTAPGAGNVISGNTLDGINVDGTTIIHGNRIGTTADGTGPLGNGRYGINATSDTVVGGILPGQGNVIAYNASFGVQVGAFGTGLNNAVRGNSIHDNGSLGINFYPQIVPVPNDAGDADNGSNHFQNFPILQSVTTGASTHVVGKFNSTPSTTFDVDFYANPACSRFPREFLQGETYLGSFPVTTDGNGNAAIDVTLPAATEAGARVSATATDPAGNTSEFSQRIVFTMGPASGPAAGGTFLNVLGTDFADPATMTVGGVATSVSFIDDHTLHSTSPALPPGTVNDVVVTTPDGTAGTLVRGWVSDFLDVPGAQQFYSFVTTLVSNAITVGVGQGLYGVNDNTIRQQMAVFLMKAKHGLCYTPPPCTTQLFTDVPCSSNFAPWINELVTEGITGGCGPDTYCPADPVKRQQMAVLLLKTFEGTGYAPPACVTASFGDVPCASPFAPWIYELVNRQITGGCGNGNYCPTDPATRGQMAVFVVKTFNLQ